MDAVHAWCEPLANYIRLSLEHHRLTLAQNSKQALAARGETHDPLKSARLRPGGVALPPSIHEYASSARLARSNPDGFEPAQPFGDHLWYIVRLDGSVSAKINRPYFGTDGYLRFSYASSRMEFDTRELERRLKNRLTLMIQSLALACESMGKTDVRRHLEKLG